MSTNSLTTTPLIIHNVKLITPNATLENGWLVTQNGKITQIGQTAGDMPQIAGAEIIDGQGLTLLPGFIDVHVHGAQGFEAMDATPQSLQTMAQFYAAHGVTAFLPTTWTQPRENIQSALENIAACMGQQPNGATIVGAHLEGPYISVEKRGAQRERDVRRAEREEAQAFLDTGVIRLISVAPEYPENWWLIEACVERGITVSLAHTTATYDQVKYAATLGITHSTHTYNAMTGLSHRDPGAVGALMTTPSIRCELIADNIHVHPAAMQVLFLTKGVEGVILITDAIRSAGLPDGEYAIDDRTVTLKDGAVRLEDGTLAGSILTFDKAVYNFMQATQRPLDAIWQTTSLNAARAIHLEDRKGSLEVGKDADLVLVDDQINVQLTVAEGVIVYRK